MSKASPSMQQQQSLVARRNRKLSAAIEGLESRAYLTGVVFGNPVSTSASQAGIAPVYIQLDNVTANGVATSHADLITANSSGGAGSISVLPGNGDGTFGTATTIPLPFTPLTIRTGELNPASPSQKDIVVGSSNSNQFAVLLPNGSGQFTTATTYTATGLTDTQSVAIGDFNGDGAMDIAVASLDSGTANNVATFTNQGNGTFMLQQVVSVPHAQVASITAFTGSSASHQNLAVADASSNSVTVLLNDGSGNFGNLQDYNLGSQGGNPVTIVNGQFDLNANGNDDLATANAQGGSVSVLIGNGDGTFQPTPVTTSLGTVVASGGGPLKVRVSNLNNDGIPDLICLLSSGSSGDAAVLLGNGDGTFHIGNVIGSGTGAYSAIAAGDLSGDGLTDMVLANATQVTSLINTTNQDTSPPTAAVDVTQPALTLGSATIPFTVTYTDQFQVDAGTVNSGNITVTGPGGTSLPVTLVSSNLANGKLVTVTYSVPAPSGALSTADNGAYAVTTTSNAAQAVKNANGVPTAGAAIGSFTVTAPTANSNGANLVAGAVNVRNPASAVAGSRFAGATSVVVVNSGNQAAKGKIVVELFALPSAAIPGGTQPLETVTRNVNLRPGARTVLSLPGFKWPAGLTGSQFIVADVNATQTIPETNFSDNVGISAKSTNVALPFVDIDNLWNGKLPVALKVGRRVPVPVALKNVGNVTARGTATYTMQAVDVNNASNSVTVGTGSVRIAMPTNGRRAVSLPLTLPTTLATGTYHLMVTLSLPGDTNAGNDTASSSGTFTV